VRRKKLFFLFYQSIICLAVVGVIVEVVTSLGECHGGVRRLNQVAVMRAVLVALAVQVRVVSGDAILAVAIAMMIAWLLIHNGMVARVALAPGRVQVGGGHDGAPAGIIRILIVGVAVGLRRLMLFLCLDRHHQVDVAALRERRSPLLLTLIRIAHKLIRVRHL
jgi:hypothetical protein